MNIFILIILMELIFNKLIFIHNISINKIETHREYIQKLYCI